MKLVATSRKEPLVRHDDGVDRHDSPVRAASVDVENLSISYGKEQIVRNANFKVYRGEYLGILGPSGCGKTTILRAIAGLEKPRQGTILVDNKIVFSEEKRTNLAPERRNVGLVFQSWAIWPHMSVGENIAYGLKLRGLSRAVIEERTHWAAKLIQLEALMDRKASQLSGGQQQRVALARSLVTSPAVLLLDEPLSNLDQVLRIAVRAEMAALKLATGVTAIHVTHDQEEAFALCDRIIVMHKGEAIQVGSPADLYRYPRNKFVAQFLGATNHICGTVSKSVRGEGFAVAVGSNIEFRVTRLPAKGPGPVEIAIRPHSLKLSRERPQREANVWQADVLQRIYLGTTTQYRLRLNHLELEVRSDVPDLYEVGSQIWVHVSPEDCLILEEGEES